MTRPLVPNSLAITWRLALLLLGPVLVPLQACTDLSENPPSAITPANFYRNEAEVVSSLAGIYAQLRSTLDDYYNISEISTDEMIVPTRGSDWYDRGRGEDAPGVLLLPADGPVRRCADRHDDRAQAAASRDARLGVQVHRGGAHRSPPDLAGRMAGGVQRADDERRRGCHPGEHVSQCRGLHGYRDYRRPAARAGPLAGRHRRGGPCPEQQRLPVG